MLESRRSRSSSVSRSRVASAPVSMSARAADSRRATSSSGSFPVPHALLHDARPVAHPADREVARRVHLLERSEVREQEDRAGGPTDPLDRVHVPLEVELRRWCGGPEHGKVGHVDPEGIAREHRPGARVDERHVVRRMPGCLQDEEVAVAEGDRVRVLQRTNAAARDGLGRSEELAHLGFPPDARGARDQARRVDEVRCATLVHPDRGAREALGEPADPTRVIEVDVREHDVRELVGGHAERVERLGDRFDRRPRSGFDQAVSVASRR